MNQNKWLVVLLGASMLLNPLASSTAAARQQPVVRDPDMLRQMVNEDSGKLYLPQTGPAPEILPMAADVNLPTWSRLAFQSYRGNNWDIYLVDPGGANETQLTTFTSIEGDPSLSRGGAFVAFDSNKDGNNDIFTINANGSGLNKLAANSASDSIPVFSPDGSRILFQSMRTGNADLFVMNKDGSGLTQLTTSSAYDGEATWSPDGSRIAFVSKRSGSYDVWSIKVDGTDPRQLTLGSTTATPAWSPLGDKIVYSNDSTNDGFYELWWMNADGSNPQLRLQYPQRDYWGTSWSPDGNSIAYIGTDWTYYQNNWYWTHSYMYFMDPVTKGSINGAVTDDRVFRVSWASTDITPPDPCTINNLKSSQPWTTFPVSWSATEAGSGVASYDVQVRSAGGSWQDFLALTSQTSQVYTGADGTRLEFRCRARDIAGNEQAWEPAPISSTVIQSTRPVSTAHVNQRYAKGQVQVNWEGFDAFSGIANYDIFVRDGKDGDWETWLGEVTYTSATYAGTPGHTYYFRSQAHNLAKITQAWQPDPQGVVTFYDATLTIGVRDLRDHPLPTPPITLAPPAFSVDGTGQSPFEKKFGLQTPNPVQVSIAAPGFGSLQDTLLDIPGDRSFGIILPPVDDLVANGGLETGSLNGWNLSRDGASISSTSHTGQHALKLMPGSGNDSSLSQTVTVADTMLHPTLSFLYYLPENSGNDEFSVAVTGDTELAVLTTTATTPGWTHIWADLSDFAGQPVALTFKITGTGAAVYVDEVSLGSWNVPQIVSVSPQTWQAGQSQPISITGENFSGLPQVFLNDIALTGVELVGSTQINAQTPTGMLGGYYRLRVVNPDGTENVLADLLALPPLPYYIPLVARQGNLDINNSLLAFAWPTLGGDDHRSGYAPNASSVSRYSQVWSNHPLNGTYAIKQVVEADGILIAAVDGSFGSMGVFAYELESGRELWNYQFTGKFSVNPATIANGMVYFQQGNAGDTYLFCLDLYTGQKLWQAPFGAQWERYLHPLVVGGKVYVNGGTYGGMYIFDAASGDQIAFLQGPQYDGWTPSYANDKIYTWVAGTFVERSPVDGNPIWSLGLDWSWHGYTMNTAAVIENRTAFIVSPTALSAIDLDTHTLKWSAPGNYDDTLPVVAGGVVYAIKGNMLEALNATNGALLDSFSAPENLINSPVVTGTSVYVASANSTFLLDRTTLDVKWSASEGGWVTVADGFLLIARPNGIISAYRAEEP